MRAKCLVFVFLMVVMVGVSFGQRTTATFAGIVTDSSNAVLPGAEIQLINQDTAAVTQQLTGETGEFVFNFVPAGTYTLKISMPGFKGYDSQGIPLGAAQNVRRTYVLEVGSITDNVTVTGDAPLVNTLSPEQRLSLDTLEVRNLPMANRNVTNILEIGSGLTKVDSGPGGVRFRLNGLGGAAMSITSDGSDASGNAGSTTIGAYGAISKIDVMSAESVAAVQVVKGVVPAEYGSAMGGNMSIITKSGTNKWHGSLLYRYEGSALGARSATLLTKPNSVWNQFGGSLGGPVKKDKAFFFFAYEGYRQITALALSPTVPTPRLRDIMMASLPPAETKLFLDFYPLPNQPYASDALLAFWVGPASKVNNDDHFDAKFDYLVGGGNLAIAFNGGHPYQSQASSSPLAPQTFTTSTQHANLNYTVGKGRWTSSTRAGYNRNFGQRIDAFWYVKDPKKAETTPGTRRIMPITFTGMTGLGGEENHTRGLIPSWSFEEQVALFRGTHSWKFGALLALPSGGQPDSDAMPTTFQTIQDIMQNTPSSVQYFGGNNSFTWRMLNFGVFAQDDWRVNRQLVLNLGIRYDRYGHFVAKPWNADQPAGLFNSGLIDAGRMIFGPVRDANNPFESDNLNLGPRFGFAYTPGTRGNFVVRGGFGVNFQGFDGGHYEGQVGRTIDLPNRATFSRVESAARGLKWPVYNEDLAATLKAEAGGKPALPGSRFDPFMEAPYAMNYTLGIQRELTRTMVLETAFVGSRGVKFNMVRTYNDVDRLTGIRINPNDISGTYTDNSQQTNYNSWQSTLKSRLSHGLLFNMNYTWGKAMSYTGGDTSPSRSGDARASIQDFDAVKIERSPSTGDVTHSVIFDWVYSVPSPFPNSVVAKRVLGGWQVSGVWKAQTGGVLGVTQTGGRPDIIDFAGAVNQECCGFGNRQYLNPAAFQLVPVVTASVRTIRRGYASSVPFRGPGLTNLNLSLGKNFPVRETIGLELKADLLNALNTVNYTNIQNNLSGVAFGQARGTLPARTIQLQLRLSF